MSENDQENDEYNHAQKEVYQETAKKLESLREQQEVSAQNAPDPMCRPK